MLAVHGVYWIVKMSKREIKSNMSKQNDKVLHILNLCMVYWIVKMFKKEITGNMSQLNVYIGSYMFVLNLNTLVNYIVPNYTQYSVLSPRNSLKTEVDSLD